MRILFSLIGAAVLLSGCDVIPNAPPPIDNAVAVDCGNSVGPTNESDAALCPEGTNAEMSTQNEGG